MNSTLVSLKKQETLFERVYLAIKHPLKGYLFYGVTV